MLMVCDTLACENGSGEDDGRVEQYIQCNDLEYGEWYNRKTLGLACIAKGE